MTKWMGMPESINFAIMICRLTLSKAFEKSTSSNHESCCWLSLSSIDHISCSYCSGADLPLIAPYWVAVIIWLRSLIACRMVSSYSFITVLISDMGL